MLHSDCEIKLGGAFIPNISKLFYLPRLAKGILSLLSETMS